MPETFKVSCSRRVSVVRQVSQNRIIHTLVRSSKLIIVQLRRDEDDEEVKDEQENPILIGMESISCLKPSVHKCFLVGFFVVPIAKRNVWPTEPQFSSLVDICIRPVIPENSSLHSGKEDPCGLRNIAEATEYSRMWFRYG
jgi:hypothetical protein